MNTITSDDLMIEENQWSSRCVSWTIRNQAHIYSYYASYVAATELWYITGPADYHRTRAGISTAQLLEILNIEAGEMWVTCDWVQVRSR